MSVLSIIAYPLWAYVLATVASPLWIIMVRRAVDDPTTTPMRRSRLGALMHASIWLSAFLDRGIPREAAVVLITLHVVAMLFYFTLAKRYAMEREGD